MTAPLRQVSIQDSPELSTARDLHVFGPSSVLRYAAGPLAALRCSTHPLPSARSTCKHLPNPPLDCNLITAASACAHTSQHASCRLRLLTAAPKILPRSKASPRRGPSRTPSKIETPYRTVTRVAGSSVCCNQTKSSFYPSTKCWLNTFHTLITSCSLHILSTLITPLDIVHRGLSCRLLSAQQAGSCVQYPCFTTPLVFVTWPRNTRTKNTMLRFTRTHARPHAHHL